MSAPGPSPRASATGSLGPLVGELTHREIMAVFAGLMTAMLLAALDQTIVATALPAIVEDLGGLEHLSWVVTAYLLTATVTVPLWGKLSDLHGRKRLFQLAIVVFLVGSVLCAVSPSIFALSGARAVQGVGAGGLIVLAQTIVGDTVAPRQRGRYMGYIGAVFGFASIVGPLLGGYLVDSLTWHWVFLVNLPVGAAALVVTQRNLRVEFERRDHRVDYLGAALLVVGITALLLVSVWGGETFPWDSALIVALTVASLAALIAFVFVEMRAEEPILPLELFRDRTFTIATSISFVVGAAMFGAVIFLPLFLQAVVGVSATASGLALLPLVVALLAASITSGRLITRWGRYRVFPIVGTALMTVGLVLLGSIGPDVSQLRLSLYMALFGVGIGCVMQVMVLVVQNAVPFRHLGAATSATQFFRSIGGTLGVAAFGALLNARFAASLAGTPGIGRLPDADGLGPEAIAALPAAVRSLVRVSLSDAITSLYATAVPVAVIAFLLALTLRELPLRSHGGAAVTGTEGAPGHIEDAEVVESSAASMP